MHPLAFYFTAQCRSLPETAGSLSSGFRNVSVFLPRAAGCEAHPQMSAFILSKRILNGYLFFDPEALFDGCAGGGICVKIEKR